MLPSLLENACARGMLKAFCPAAAPVNRQARPCTCKLPGRSGTTRRCTIARSPARSITLSSCTCSEVTAHATRHQSSCPRFIPFCPSLRTHLKFKWQLQRYLLCIADAASSASVSSSSNSSGTSVRAS